MRADAEQAHRALGGLGALEQRLRAVDELEARVGEVFGGVAARHGGEVGVAHLDGDGARAQALALQLLGDILGEELDLAVHFPPVGEVFGVGGLAGDGFGLPVGFDRALIDAVRELHQPLGEAAHGFASSSEDAVRTSTRRSMPMARSFFAVTGPTPQSASTGSFCRKDSTLSGAITVSPSGFCQPEAIFARNLFGATPADAVRFSCSRIV